MSGPYIGEIRMFAGSFEPVGWAFCDGRLLPISENDTLFTLIGTTYGGDGQETFALPDLRGRFPMHTGGSSGQGPGLSSHTIGELAGTETVTLTVNQIPSHTHALIATSAVGTQSSPANNYYSASGVQLYAEPAVASPIAMKNTLGGATGGSQPHENLSPYLCINFIINLYGLFPHV